jgi:hypothetical protein
MVNSIEGFSTFLTWFFIASLSMPISFEGRLKISMISSPVIGG